MEEELLERNVVKNGLGNVLDDWFSYRTVKVVKIKDKKLGSLDILLRTTTIAFVFLYLIYYNQGYLEFDQPTGSIQVTFSTPEIKVNSPPNYCSSSCSSYSGETGCDCFFYDAKDLVYPEEEEYSAFFATSFYNKYQEKITNKPCEIVETNKLKCTSPWSNESSIVQRKVLEPQKYILKVAHEALAPIFFQGETGFGLDTKFDPKWTAISENLWGQIYDREGNVIYESSSKTVDTFPLSTLFKAAGITADEVIDKHHGTGIMRIVISYYDCTRITGINQDTIDCSSYVSNLPKQHQNINYYQYQVSFIEETTYSQLRNLYNINLTERSIVNSTGIRLIFQVAGKVGQFNFANTMLSVVSGYILFSLGRFVTDAILLFVLPQRKIYRKAKYESTENFSKLRQHLLEEKNIEKKINKLKGMARFKDISEVEYTIDTLKDLLDDNERDQLLMACVEVYGTEILDFQTANNFIAQMKTEESKIKAHILLDQLNEAFTLAENLKNLKQILAIKEAAINDGNQFIEERCNNYLK